MPKFDQSKMKRIISRIRKIYKMKYFEIYMLRLMNSGKHDLDKWLDTKDEYGGQLKIRPIIHFCQIVQLPLNCVSNSVFHFDLLSAGCAQRSREQVEV